ELREPVEQHLEVAALVGDLRGQEHLGQAVRGDRDEAARALEGGRLADAVVAQDRDEPLALGGLERLVGDALVLPEAGAREVAGDRLEPELERVHLLAEGTRIELVHIGRRPAHVLLRPSADARLMRTSARQGRSGVWYSRP